LSDHGLTYADIEGIYLEGFSDRGLGGSLWQEFDVATARVDFEDAAGVSHQLSDFTSFDKRGFPTFRFSDPFSSGMLWQGLPDPIEPSTVLRSLGARLDTGQDDLRGDSTASLVLWLLDGTTREVTLIGDQFALGGESQEFRQIPLTPALTAGEIVAVGLRLTSASGPFPDNWNVNRFELFAQTDPLATWVQGLEQIVEELQGAESPIAFGTDFNGFDVQLPYTDPVTTELPQELDALPSSFIIAREQTLGTRTFTLEGDGLAHVGLMPNFVDRIVRTSSSAASRALLTSAERTIRTWRTAEAAAPAVAASIAPASPPGTGGTPPAP
jgi:hypothetical protein